MLRLRAFHEEPAGASFEAWIGGCWSCSRVAGKLGVTFSAMFGRLAIFASLRAVGDCGNVTEV
jgi:hypothetical protein